MGNAQLWVSAIEVGAFYSLIALAFYLTLVGTGFFNFALGPLAMLAGISTSWLVLEKDLPVGIAGLVAVVAVVALSAVIELLVVRPVQSRSGGGEMPSLVAVAAILFGIQEMAGVLYGYSSLAGQPLLATGQWNIGDAVIQPWALPLLGAAVLMFAVIAAWTRWRPTGRLLRAVGDSSSAARLLGLPVGRVRLIAFSVSGLVVAVAGLLFAPKAGVSSTDGLQWTLTGFLALVVGGTGSLWGPMLGGAVLGLLQVFIPYYLGGEFLDYALLALAIGFFAFRPEGLFTRTVRV